MNAVLPKCKRSSTSKGSPACANDCKGNVESEFALSRESEIASGHTNPINGGVLLE